jgi:Arc/MetJ family transcription regulator
MNDKRQKSVAELVSDRKVVDKALRRAVREALIEHKKAGRSIVVWRDGRVVRVPAKEIRVSRER